MLTPTTLLNVSPCDSTGTSLARNSKDSAGRPRMIRSWTSRELQIAAYVTCPPPRSPYALSRSPSGRDNRPSSVDLDSAAPRTLKALSSCFSIRILTRAPARNKRCINSALSIGASIRGNFSPHPQTGKKMKTLVYPGLDQSFWGRCLSSGSRASVMIAPVIPHFRGGLVAEFTRPSSVSVRVLYRQFLSWVACCKSRAAFRRPRRSDCI